MGMVRGSGPSHPPKKVGLAKSRLMGRLTGREAADEESSWEIWHTARGRGPPPR